MEVRYSLSSKNESTVSLRSVASELVSAMLAMTNMLSVTMVPSATPRVASPGRGMVCAPVEKAKFEKPVHGLARMNTSR